ncbi:MAG: diguanylate cyclase [Deltaproteobacteria bacterium]|nr:diguanylate cyclase [Deltaproteobacteria bacterium]
MKESDPSGSDVDGPRVTTESVTQVMEAPFAQDDWGLGEISQARPHARGTLPRLQMTARPGIDPVTGLYRFEFFHALAQIELKRVRRYGQLLSACLVGLDDSSVREVSTAAWEALKLRVARRVHGVIREIDHAVMSAEGRILVLLPCTSLEGAEKAGRRLATAVQLDGPLALEGQTILPTVSVGVAAMRAERCSFARLVRDAATALRAAQLKGGGQVVVRG